MDIIKYCLIFLSQFIFLFLNLIVNIFYFKIIKLKENSSLNSTILQKDYYERKKWVNDSNRYIEKYSLKLIYFFYQRIDFIYNFFKHKHSPSNNSFKNFNNKVDIYVLIILILLIAFYIIGSCANNFIIDIVFNNIIIWRLVSLFNIRLNEISTLKNKEVEYSSFFRNYIYIFLNLIDIVIAYSYLYSSYFFKIFDKRNFFTILSTLNIFVDWDLSKFNNICVIQGVLILTQILFFLIIISFLIANIMSFKYKKD
jgi:hypothetical protein